MIYAYIFMILASFAGIWCFSGLSNVQGGIHRRVIMYFFNFLILIVFFMIITHSNFPDMVAYESAYYRFQSFDDPWTVMEPGFTSLMTFFGQRLGLSFSQFIMVCHFICLLMIFYTYKNFTYNVSYFIFCFSLFNFFFEGGQIRHYLAISLVIFGISFLFRNDVKGLFLYIICVITASLMHLSALAYLIFIIERIQLRQLFYSFRNRVFIVSLFTILMGLISYMGKTQALVPVLSGVARGVINFYVADKIESHAGNGELGGGAFFYCILYLMYYLAIRCFNKRMEDQRILNLDWEIDVIHKKWIVCPVPVAKRFLDFVEKINLLGLLFIPLVFIRPGYSRLLRMVCIFDIIYFATIFNNSIIREKKKVIFVNCILIFLWIFYELIYPDRFFDIVFGTLR